MNRVSTLKRPREFPGPSVPEQGGIIQDLEVSGLPRHQIYQHLDLALLASGTMENKCCL